MFKTTEPGDIGININCRNLNHLRYANDIVLISVGLKKTEEILINLVNTSPNKKINGSKTKFMINFVPRDRKERIALTWAAHGKIKLLNPYT